MWSGTLHDKEFLTRVLEHVETNKDKYGTYDRMKGMVTLAKEVCGADVWLVYCGTYQLFRSSMYHSTSRQTKSPAPSTVSALRSSR